MVLAGEANSFVGIRIFRHIQPSMGRIFTHADSTAKRWSILTKI